MIKIVLGIEVKIEKVMEEFDKRFEIETLATDDEPAKIDSFLYDEIKSFIFQVLEDLEKKEKEIIMGKLEIRN